MMVPFKARPGLSCASLLQLPALLCMLALAGATPSRSQDKAGVVDGRLVNGTDASQVPAKVEIEVIRLSGGMSTLKSSMSDASGRFHFDALPTDAALMLRATYKSVNYHARVQFEGAKAQVQLQVFEPAAAPSSVHLEALQMAFQLNGDHLQTLESYSFRNDTSPPRTYANPDGTFRFSKAPGILEPPRMDVTGPGSTMPLADSPLESADGQNYYTAFPMRPGVTSFEVEQALPYAEHTYTFRKKFYHDAPSFQIGVRPRDIKVSGEGLANIKVDAAQNIAVYSGGPIKAGTEVVWTFSGGSPLPSAPATEAAAPTQSRVQPAPTTVAQYALVIGPLLLLGLIGPLWYAFNRLPEPGGAQNVRAKELRERREQLLTFVADLDKRHESQSIQHSEYVRQREAGKRQLRRITMLLGRVGKTSR
jgi:hypothetical protein